MTSRYVHAHGLWANGDLSRYDADDLSRPVGSSDELTDKPAIYGRRHDRGVHQ